MNKQPEVTAATRKKIMDSFWEQYKEKPIEKITISSITKSAGVHRSTFYEYFKDIYDLLEQSETDLLEEIRTEFLPIAKENIAQIKEMTFPIDINNFMNLTLALFTKHGEQLYHLAGSSGDVTFRRQLYNFFKANFIDVHGIPADSPYADYLSSFIFAVILHNMEYWYEHKDTITIEEVILLTYKLLGDGLSRRFFYEEITGNPS